MREIKFRVWDKIEKEIINWEKLQYNTQWFLNSLLWEWNWKPMQYTGLKDKNGLEIFNGDILYFEMYKDSWFVKYDEAKGAFVVVWNNPKEWCPTENEIAYRWKDCEIIGNIYENDLIDK